MEDITMGAMGLGVIGFFGIWILISFFSIFVVHLRWIKAGKLSRSDKFQVNVLMLFSWVMSAASVGIFFTDLDILYLLAILLASNISYLWCITFTLGYSTADPKKIDGSFARLRTVVLFSTFLQIVAFILSFADVGSAGLCSSDLPITYIFHALYGLQILALLMFVFEKCFGFGRADN